MEESICPEPGCMRGIWTCQLWLEAARTHEQASVSLDFQKLC